MVGKPRWSQLLVKIAPLLFVAMATSVWFNDVQDGGRWVGRNLLPLVIWVLLGAATLVRGGGLWLGDGWKFPLGLLGFAIPSLGLGVYLHWAYTVNLDGMFDEGAGDLFRYLPAYTLVAGGIGFGIGWIVGRQID